MGNFPIDFKLDQKAFAVLVLGPSGVGKTSICLGGQFQDPDVRSCVTTTTRPKRDEESDGVDYHFVSETVFRKGLTQGDFVEYAEVHGFLYGATVKAVSDVFSRGWVMLLDVDVQGAETWKKVLASRCVTVFILPPTWEVLKKRLKNRRTESLVSFNMRIKNAKKELVRAYEYDYLIVNENITKSVFQLQQIIDGEKHRPCRMVETLAKFRIPEEH